MKSISRGLGGYMSNKEELLEAIEHYDVFTKKQKKILQTLVQASISNKAVIGVPKLASAAKATKASVYQTIDLFKKNQTLEVLMSSGGRITSFLLNEKKLEEIREIYDTTKNL